MYPLNKKIGIIGGGQLGKMMILDAKRLGLTVITLDPDDQCPSSSITDTLIQADFHNERAYKTLADQVDVITYEFEHIHADILQKLEAAGHEVYPTPTSLKIIQNKLSQKTLLRTKGIAMPDFMAVHSLDDIKKAGQIFGYPLMLKATTGGYDGKGNAVVKSEEDCQNQYNALGAGAVGLMAEKFLNFTKEVSVLACRTIDGHITVYPVAENIHEDNILIETLVPANLSESSTKKAMSMAHDVMEIFEGVGMFCTEMFVDDLGNIYLNEVAPRPHNSGHYTIEGTLTSQFEQHIRAITGLPLGDVSLRCPIVMRNLLGQGHVGPTQVEGLDQVYNNPRAKVHIYGKTQSKPGRKMGHLTVIGQDLNQIKHEAQAAARAITIKGGDQ